MSKQWFLIEDKVVVTETYAVLAESAEEALKVHGEGEAQQVNDGLGNEYVNDREIYPAHEEDIETYGLDG